MDNNKPVTGQQKTSPDCNEAPCTVAEGFLISWRGGDFL